LGGKELLESRHDIGTGERSYLFAGQKFKDGYLIKTMNLKSLDVQGIAPTLDEVESSACISFFSLV